MLDPFSLARCHPARPPHLPRPLLLPEVAAGFPKLSSQPASFLHGASSRPKPVARRPHVAPSSSVHPFSFSGSSLAPHRQGRRAPPRNPAGEPLLLPCLGPWCDDHAGRTPLRRPKHSPALVEANLWRLRCCTSSDCRPRRPVFSCELPRHQPPIYEIRRRRPPGPAALPRLSPKPSYVVCPFSCFALELPASCR